MSNGKGDKSIFSEALTRHTFEERTALLIDSCGDDLDQRRPKTGGFNGLGFDGSTLDARGLLGSQENQVIGRYRSLYLVDEGGMVLVYMAEHS